MDVDFEDMELKLNPMDVIRPEQHTEVMAWAERGEGEDEQMNLLRLKGKTVEEIEAKKKEVAEGTAKLEAATARVGELAPRVSVVGVQQAGVPGIGSTVEAQALLAAASRAKSVAPSAAGGIPGSNASAGGLTEQDRQRQQRHLEARGKSPTSRKIFYLSVSDYMSDTRLTTHNYTEATGHLKKLQQELQTTADTGDPTKTDKLKSDISKLKYHIDLIDACKIFTDKGKMLSLDDSDFLVKVKLLQDNSVPFYSNNQLLIVARNMKASGDRIKAIVLKGKEIDIDATVESLVSMCVPWLPSDVDAKEINFSYTLTESRLSDIIGLDVKDIVKAFEECFFYFS